MTRVQCDPACAPARVCGRVARENALRCVCGGGCVGAWGDAEGMTAESKRQRVHESGAADSGRPVRSGAMKKLGTHDGTFHCDEAFAIYMLRLLDEYKDAEVVRSRDPKVWEGVDVLVDVGAVYDHQAKRYDHHQRGFEEFFSLERSEIKLSSAGLVYKHYGRDIIKAVLPGVRDDALEVLYTKVYSGFIEAIDAIDNGIQMFESTQPARYSMRTDLSSRVGALNQNWNESDEDFDAMARFKQASELAGTEFVACVKYYANVWLPARDIVVLVLNSRFLEDSSGNILVLEQFCPWKAHLFDLEEELAIPAAERPLFVIYADYGKSWRVQAVPETESSFKSRKPLPEAWRGLRDDELSAKSGIPGCIFVHAAGFIGGNVTKEGALEMARQALRIE
ncbi:UPF0160 protein C27H6.8 [Porphyridium purpureum]|uniref:UPF0160 protein C27H6.8 n=1 Tax=Porphyridium purpureum TaxID=35688 RepID=A0A5J4Z7J2_PORPP|nr:UPF0160 protein C27H6.8 [Porphyridium purpureum]|eukprot:POR3581..scf295_1